MDDRQVRMECLKMASHSSVTSDQILGLAQEFYVFVAGGNRITGSSLGDRRIQQLRGTDPQVPKSPT